MRHIRTILRIGLLTVCTSVSASAQQRALSGVTFVVDTSADLTRGGPGVARSLGLKVTYAAGRGRADVVARPARPALKIGDVVVAPALAAPGDYYLFDSTGFVLVTPATKRFFSFRIADAAFNYEGRRDGWPAFFAVASTRTDTVLDPAAVVLTQHAEYRMYWHLDAVKDTICVVGGCSVGELARGRTTVADAPAEELLVARWFGPAQALAEIPGGIGRLLGKPSRVTTVSPVTGIHRLRDLRRTTVAERVLTLPSDYTEAPWPGSSAATRPAPSDGGAKWRTMP